MECNIALLDRNNSFSLFMNVLLNRMGLELSIFKSLATFSNASPAKYDLIFVGDMIDDATTLEAVDRIRSMVAEKNQIIVLSIVSDKQTVDAALQAGVADYLLKPVNPKNLHRTIFDNLEKRSGRRFHLRGAVELEAKLSSPGYKGNSRVLSLSPEGVLIDVDAALEVGEQVKMELPIPDLVRPLAGRVIYRQEEGSPDRNVFAVHFNGISMLEYNAIDRFLVNRLLLEAWKHMPFVPQNVAALDL